MKGRRFRYDPETDQVVEVAEDIPRGTMGVAQWPLESRSAGCMRAQVEEFNRDLEAAGITGARHKENGDLVIESRQARNQVLKHRGIIDQDGGYGDYVGK
jgi:hypothetical protein